MWFLDKFSVFPGAGGCILFILPYFEKNAIDLEEFYRNFKNFSLFFKMLLPFVNNCV